MEVLLRELAQLVDGQLSGDGDTIITGADTIRDSKVGSITLADQPKLADSLAKCDAAAVVVSSDFSPERIAYITVENVHASFAKIVQRFQPPRTRKRIGVSKYARVSQTARIGQDVEIHADASIGDNVCIGDGSTIHSGVRIMDDCQIGSHVTIFPNAVLYENARIGDHSIIHACAVIGAYGFGYKTIDGRHHLSAQLGNVEIGSNVEIGACTTIDRGTYGPTKIGEGTKIDNQVIVAHNCRIGRHNIICSHVGIAGSASTGDYVVMAGQVGVADHIEIGDQVTLGAKAGVMNEVPSGETWFGIPATPSREQMTRVAALGKMPEMRKQFKELRRQVKELTKQVASTRGRDAA